MKAFVKISPTAKWFPLSQISSHQLFGHSLQDLYVIACQLGKFDDITNTAILSRATLVGNRSFSDMLTVVKIYDL